MARLAGTAAAAAIFIAASSFGALAQSSESFSGGSDLSGGSRSYAFNVQPLRRPAQNYSTPIPNAQQTTPQYRPPILILHHRFPSPAVR